MTSNIRLKRVCAQCEHDFIAKTSVTQYCSDICAKKAYKARLRAKKIQTSQIETRNIKLKKIEQNEYLTSREASILLNCDVRSVYRYIKAGNIKAFNLGRRLTRIRRSDLQDRST